MVPGSFVEPHREELLVIGVFSGQGQGTASSERQAFPAVFERSGNRLASAVQSFRLIPPVVWEPAGFLLRDAAPAACAQWNNPVSIMAKRLARIFPDNAPALLQPCDHGHGGRIEKAAAWILDKWQLLSYSLKVKTFPDTFS